MTPVFQIDRLFYNEMNLYLPEFSSFVTTAFKYNMWARMLCFDVYWTTENYRVLIDLTIRMVECYKTLIDCFFDFGQSASNDNVDSQKPYGPFAKIFDYCELSSTQSVDIKEFKPLESDTVTRTTYFVGSGNYDDSCFPGNILIPLIDWDHNANLTARALGGAGVRVESRKPEELEGWKKVMYDYLEPYYHKAVMSMFEFAQQDLNSNFSPDHQDGT